MWVGVGKMFESICLFVCLFVRSVTQKRMIPKCSNLVYGLGMTSGYPKVVVVLFWSSKVKGQGHKVSKFISDTIEPW